MCFALGAEARGGGVLQPYGPSRARLSVAHWHRSHSQARFLPVTTAPAPDAYPSSPYVHECRGERYGSARCRCFSRPVLCSARAVPKILIFIFLHHVECSGFSRARTRLPRDERLHSSSHRLRVPTPAGIVSPYPQTGPPVSPWA